jgi:hypothetical protein
LPVLVVDLQWTDGSTTVTWLHTFLLAVGLNFVEYLDEGLEVLGLGLKGERQHQGC